MTPKDIERAHLLILNHGHVTNPFGIEGNADDAYDVLNLLEQALRALDVPPPCACCGEPGTRPWCGRNTCI